MPGEVEGVSATRAWIQSAHYVEFINKSQVAHKGKCILKMPVYFAWAVGLVMRTAHVHLQDLWALPSAFWRNHRHPQGTRTSNCPSNYTSQKLRAILVSSCFLAIYLSCLQDLNISQPVSFPFHPSSTIIDPAVPSSELIFPRTISPKLIFYHQACPSPVCSIPL